MRCTDNIKDISGNLGCKDPLMWRWKMASWFPLVDKSQNAQKMVNLGKQFLQGKDQSNCDDVSGKSKCIPGMRPLKYIKID